VRNSVKVLDSRQQFLGADAHLKSADTHRQLIPRTNVLYKIIQKIVGSISNIPMQAERKRPRRLDQA